MAYSNSTRVFERNSTSINENNDILKISVLTWNWLTMTYVLTSNTLLVYGIFKTKGNKKLTMSKRLFIYLSIVDILTATTTVIQTHLYVFHMPYRFAIATAFSHGLHFMGCLTFVTITVLRYISLRYPLKKVSSQAIIIVNLIGMLFAVFHGIANYFITFQDDLNIQSFASIYWFVTLLIMFLALLIFNFLSLKHLKKAFMSAQTRSPSSLSESFKTITDVKIRENSPNDVYQNDIALSRQNIKKKKHAIKTLCCITLSYIVFNLPLMLLMLTQLYFTTYINSYETKQSFRYWVGLLYYLVLINTGNNAAIYVLRSKELRIFYKNKMLNCFRRKITSKSSATNRTDKYAAGTQESSL